MSIKNKLCLSGLVIGVFLAGSMVFAGNDKAAKDQDGFHSSAASTARNSGSPVGPPKKVTICHDGNTLSVSETSVPAHLAHGDTLGPCLDTQPKGNNGLGNGLDPQPPGNPPVNDGPGTGPGNTGNKP